MSHLRLFAPPLLSAPIRLHPSRWLALVLLVGLAPAIPLYAATETVTLALGEVIEQAASRTLAVRMADEQVLQAGGKLRAERSDLLPELRATLNQRRQDRSLAAFGLPQEATLILADSFTSEISYPGVPSELVDALNLPRQGITTVDDEIELELEFPPSTGPRDFVTGKLLLTAPVLDLPQHRELTSAHSNVARSRHRLHAVQESARRKAAELYTRIQFLAETVNTLQSVMDLKISRAQMMEDLIAADAAREIDARDAQLEVLKARGELALSRERLRTTLGELKRHLAYPAETRVRLDSRLHFRPLPVRELAAPTNSAWSLRADLQALREQESMATSQLRAEQAKRYPSVHVMGFVGPEGEAYDDTVTGWYIGFAAHLPLWDFHGRRGEIEQAGSRARQSRYQVQDLEEDIARSLAELPEAVRLRHDAVGITSEAVSLAGEKVDLQRDRQATGTGRQLDVLVAEVELREKELERFAAVFAYEMLIIEWFHTIGHCERIAAARDPAGLREASSTP